MTIETAWSMVVGVWWGLAIGAVAFSPILLVIWLWTKKR